MKRFQAFFQGSIKRTIVAPPVLIILCFTIAVQIGLALIYAQQLAILKSQEESAEMLSVAEGIPAKIATIQQDLYRLSVLGTIGLGGKEVTDSRARIEANFHELERDLAQIAGELNPALIALGVEYRRAVSQAITLIERSPVIGATATRGVEPIYKRIEEIAHANTANIKQANRDQFTLIQNRWFGLVFASFVSMVVLTGALLYLAVISSNRIISPILALAHTVERLESGMLDASVPGVDRNDELGLVSRSIESFRLSLKRVFALQKERDALNASLQEKVKQLGVQSDLMRRNAYHDTLTDLPNRRYLKEKLQELAAAGTDCQKGIAFLHIDLDRFKEINDTLGHLAGDLVLKNAAACLEGFAGPNDFVARLGGDEFAMVLPIDFDPGDGDVGDTEETERVFDLADALVLSLSQPVVLDGSSVRHGASVGIAFSSCRADKIGKVMVNSDLALYAAKEAGRNRFHVYSPNLQSAMVNRKLISDDIRRGLEENEFIPYFQAKVCADTLDLHGVEVLARWQHPTDGLKPPDAFLELAEDIGVMAEIDQQISTQAVEACERFIARGLPIEQLSVNISMARILDDSFLQAMGKLQRPNFQLGVELLETIFFEEHAEALGYTIDALKDLGVQVEIDDFGTGRASVSCLLQLSPDRVKIDRSIVRSVETDPKKIAMVRGIVQMAHAVGASVMAEGVENLHMAEKLCHVGCDMLQGFAFCKPMSEDDFTAWATSWAARAPVAATG